MKNLNIMDGREKQDKKVGKSTSTGNPKINAVKETVKNQTANVLKK